MKKYILRKDYLIFSTEAKNKDLDENAYLLISDNLEGCLRYLNKHNIANKYYIEVDAIFDRGTSKEWRGCKQPSYKGRLDDITGFINELFIPYDCDEYNEIRTNDYRPFIVEVWYREGNNLKLIFKRENETQEFVEVYDNE